MEKTTFNDVYACKAYACYIKDEEELKKSTSGGVFFVLARKVILENGVVFGAAFSENHGVRHIMAETLSELELIRKSKYVQSRIGNSYIKAKEYLEKGRKVLFSGTPCQIAGLRSFLGKEYDHLFLVDLICHGVPSEKILQEHIERLEDTKGKILRMQFRDKHNGWSNITVSYQTEKEKQYVEGYDDAYFYGFDNYYFLRPSCYECKFRGLKSGADITIGDYWGIQKEHPDFWNDNGISAVILKSKKGIEAFEECKEDFVYRESTVAKIANYNILVTAAVGKKKGRELFFKEYLKNKRDLFEVYDAMNRKLKHINIGIIGGYSSRKIVHSVKSYDEGVKISWHMTASAICSMMSDMVKELESSLSKLDNPYRRQAIQADMDKEINYKIKDKCDYLVIDFLEERHPLLYVDENKLLTFSDMFQDVCDKRLIENYKKWDMLDVPFEFWRQRCDKLISLIKEEYSPEQVILNRMYLTENYGMGGKDKKFSNVEWIREVNKKLMSMYDYFEEHFKGIHSIRMHDEKTDYCFEAFEYGCEPVYYNRERYMKTGNEIVNILEGKIETNR